MQHGKKSKTSKISPIPLFRRFDAYLETVISAEKEIFITHIPNHHRDENLSVRI